MPKDETVEEIGIYSKKKLAERIKNLNGWVENIPSRGELNESDREK